MENQNNPPAFPGDNGYRGDTNVGMTLRDYFAAKALLGAMSAKNPFTINGKILEKAEAFSKLAYGFADAMLAEREKSA